ncbi:MAG: hypothetical protein JXB49_13930 [Bacteroidales bacterium]|nr:hypothetical protein [Bacteroidales bacterium]
MENQIKKFIDILTDNRVIIKQYTPETISINDPRYDNFTFNEELLVHEDELEDEELLKFLELELPFISNAISCILNGHSQPVDLENMLEAEFEKLRNVIINTYNEIDKGELKDSAKRIKGSRSELELIIRANRKNKLYLLERLISLKIEFCAETIRFINYPIIVLSPKKSATKPRKPLENLTILNQNEISILAYYLREQGFIGKEMTKIDYANHFSALTGFAAEKIRQDLSHLGKKSNSLESIEFTQKEYKKVLRTLDEVISAIKKDSEERFSSKP